jgi:hypothetical protein
MPPHDWFRHVSGRPIRRLATLLLLLGLLGVPGCSGCGSDANDPAKQAEAQKLEERGKKKEKKKDFEIGRLTLQPSDAQPNLWVKPGHWVAASQQMKTNNFDFVGQLEISVVDKQQRPIQLEHTPFRLTTTRPAVLPKGQEKHLDMALFVPHASRQAAMRSTLGGRYGGGEVHSSGELFNTLAPHQYFFVVLADLPDRYTFVKVLHSVRVPADEDFGAGEEVHYRVIAPPPIKPLTIPSQAMTWTSIAYLVWDGVDPALLSLDQQQALLDWLHWGGQLIVSGPRSFDLLRGSFLAPYLPATDASSVELDDAALDELNAHWTIPGRRKPTAPLRATRPWSGARFTPHADAQAVPHAGGLLLERRVGRGRVVLTAMHLDERDLITWDGFDNFFNACLLRRPPRRYSTGEYGGLQLNWAEQPERRYDARLTSGLRYFTRDAGADTNVTLHAEEQYDDLGQLLGAAPSVPPQQAGGVAAWNSLSPVSNAAREALREAAGIKIPKAGFVVGILALYLIVLVPVNWLLFSALGRVEWAWVAAPVISLVFAVLVIRLAQLDIGFARSKTEIAVLEVQGDHPRGHLTRYTALYTSLSTTYDIHFDNSAAVAEPLPVSKDFELLPGQSLSTVTYRRWEDVALAGLTVASNSTGMIHSEQMLDLGGPIELGQATGGGKQVFNGGRFELEQVAVLRRKAEPRDEVAMEGAWIGRLRAGASAPLKFHALSKDEVVAGASRPRSRRRDAAATEDLPFSRERELAQSAGEAAPLELDELLALALDGEHFEPGETRLVGIVSQILPGATVDPEASQARGQTLVVAHLKFELPPEPQPDANVAGDFPQGPKSTGDVPEEPQPLEITP